MKLRIFTLGLIILIGFSTADIRAQDNGPEGPLVADLYPNALGFSFGSDISPVSIFNLHYQRWFGDFGFEASLGAVKNLNGEGTWGADGIVTLQYKFSDGNLVGDGIIYGALYGFLQSGYVASVYQDASYDEATETAIYSLLPSRYIPIGIGVGIEPVFLKHFSMPIEVGFQYQLMTDDFGPVVSGAIRYRF